MSVLSGATLIRIWEVGERLHPVDQALTILAAAFPQMSRDELAALPIGQRDARLLTVHEETFGPQLAGLAECPQCQEQLEFSFRVADIRLVPEVDVSRHSVYQLISNGYQVRFRLANSLDLALIARYGNRLPDLAAARSLLLQRCVLEALYNGQKIAVRKLPPAVITRLAAQMGQYDPQAEIEFNFNCPKCEHEWPVLFDIVAFLWRQITVQAKRVLQEVHLLARAYGWREADILSMSAVRRQFYLELVT